MTTSVEAYKLLWPPAFEQAAATEGWQLRTVARNSLVEVDFLPIPDGQPRNDYIELAKWLVFNAYVLGSPMHMIAWEFEYATNQSIYDDGNVPGDVSEMFDDNDGWKR